MIFRTVSAAILCTSLLACTPEGEVTNKTEFDPADLSSEEDAQRNFAEISKSPSDFSGSMTVEYEPIFCILPGCDYGSYRIKATDSDFEVIVRAVAVIDAATKETKLYDEGRYIYSPDYDEEKARNDPTYYDRNFDHSFRANGDVWVQEHYVTVNDPGNVWVDERHVAFIKVK